MEISNEYTKVLCNASIGSNIKNCEYAVRGAIPLLGAEISKRIKNGDVSFPFEKVIPLNIGNPQAIGQSPIQYNRDIISALINPNIAPSSHLSDDARKRVELMTSLFSTPIGAYTQNSKGHQQVRQAIANYINTRDGKEVDSDWNNIYLTSGASEGVRILVKMIVRDKQDGVLVPIPQYPLYSALLTLENGTMIKYWLDEENNWGINAE